MMEKARGKLAIQSNLQGHRIVIVIVSEHGFVFLETEIPLMTRCDLLEEKLKKCR